MNEINTGEGLSVNPEQSLIASFVIVSVIATSMVMKHFEGKEDLRPSAGVTHDDSSIVSSYSFISTPSCACNLLVNVICCCEANTSDGNCEDESSTTCKDELRSDDEDDDAVATTAGVDDVTVSMTARST
jgi:hypothetical protein